MAICPALVLGPPVSPRRDGESVSLMAKICRVGSVVLPAAQVLLLLVLHVLPLSHA